MTADSVVPQGLNRMQKNSASFQTTTKKSSSAERLTDLLQSDTALNGAQSKDPDGAFYITQSARSFPTRTALILLCPEGWRLRKRSSASLARSSPVRSCSLGLRWSKGSNSMGKISAPPVLGLRAISALLRDRFCECRRSLRRTKNRRREPLRDEGPNYFLAKCENFLYRFSWPAGGGPELSRKAEPLAVDFDRTWRTTRPEE